MDWLMGLFGTKAIVSYVATVALGYAFGWFRGNAKAQAVWNAVKDGKIDEAEAAAGIGFIKGLLGKK